MLPPYKVIPLGIHRPLEDMDADEFLSHGFLDALDEDCGDATSGASKSKPKGPSSGKLPATLLNPDSEDDDDGAENEEEEEEGEDDEDNEAEGGAAMDEDDDADTDADAADDSTEDADETDGMDATEAKIATLTTENARKRDVLAQHRQQLDRLKEKQADFYKFLQANDKVSKLVGVNGESELGERWGGT